MVFKVNYTKVSRTFHVTVILLLHGYPREISIQADKSLWMKIFLYTHSRSCGAHGNPGVHHWDGKCDRRVLRGTIHLFIYFFNFIYWPGHGAGGILAPPSGMEPVSPALKGEVLTTVPRRKSPVQLFRSN